MCSCFFCVIQIIFSFTGFCLLYSVNSTAWISHSAQKAHCFGSYEALVISNWPPLLAFFFYIKQQTFKFLQRRYAVNSLTTVSNTMIKRLKPHRDRLHITRRFHHSVDRALTGTLSRPVLLCSGQFWAKNRYLVPLWNEYVTIAVNRNLSNCEKARKKGFRCFNGIQTRGLCVSAPVLYQPELWRPIHWRPANLLTHKVLLQNYKEDIKWNLAGEETIISVWRFFFDTALKLEKISQFFPVWNHFHPHHPKRQGTVNSFSPIYTILGFPDFLLMRRQVLIFLVWHILK